MLFSATLESRYPLLNTVQKLSCAYSTLQPKQTDAVSNVVTQEMSEAISVNSYGVTSHISPVILKIKETNARKSPLKFTLSPFVASSVPRTQTHTHMLEAHTADNRQTLCFKLINVLWCPLHGNSTKREGTSLSKREITLSLSYQTPHYLCDNFIHCCSLSIAQ